MGESNGKCSWAKTSAVKCGERCCPPESLLARAPGRRPVVPWCLPRIPTSIRTTGTGGPPGSKLARLRCLAENYDRPLNLYSSNCRIFCARVEREVERLNAEDIVSAGHNRRAELSADLRLAFAVFRAGTLPLLYPLGIVLICWDGLKGL